MPAPEDPPLPDSTLEVQALRSWHNATDHGGTFFGSGRTSKVDATLDSTKARESGVSGRRPLATSRTFPSPFEGIGLIDLRVEVPPVAECTVHGCGDALLVNHHSKDSRMQGSKPSLQRSRSDLVAIFPVSPRLRAPAMRSHDQADVTSSMSNKASTPRTPSGRDLERSTSRLERVQSSHGLAMETMHEERDLSEGEALCRICYIDLGEGRETLKMDCACRGELALVHKKCAVKWFSIKGTRICEVCGQEVVNLPVVVERRRPPNERWSPPGPAHRPWQDIPVLALANVVAYFCFYEQLLIGALGKQALALSMPAGVLVGLLATTVSWVRERKRVWSFSLLLFMSVLVFTEVFFYLAQLPGVAAIPAGAVLGLLAALGCHRLSKSWNQRRQSLTSSGNENSPITAAGGGIAEVAEASEASPSQEIAGDSSGTQRADTLEQPSVSSSALHV